MEGWYVLEVFTTVVFTLECRFVKKPWVERVASGIRARNRWSNWKNGICKMLWTNASGYWVEPSPPSGNWRHIPEIWIHFYKNCPFPGGSIVGSFNVFGRESGEFKNHRPCFGWWKKSHVHHRDAFKMKLQRFFHIDITLTPTKIARWWFQIFYVFIPIWGRFPFWLILFKGVVQPPTR